MLQQFEYLQSTEPGKMHSADLKSGQYAEFIRTE